MSPSPGPAPVRGEGWGELSPQDKGLELLWLVTCGYRLWPVTKLRASLHSRAEQRPRASWTRQT